MATPPSPAYRRIMELLADGEWHDVETIVVAAMRAVPPGPAFREGERLRQRKGGPAVRTRGSAIETGARSIARDALRGMVRFGGVVRDGDRVRLAP